jgi:hypothetical protein
MGICLDNKVADMQYDAAGGLGTIVKSEVNRIRIDERSKVLDRLHLIPWNAGGKVLFPGERVNPDDKESPINKHYFMNLKAQAWWKLRERVYNTYCAVMSGGKLNPKTGKVDCPEWVLAGVTVPATTYDPDDLISIDSRLPLLHKIIKELCQPTASKGAKLKLVVDKAPDGTRSPNLGDSIVMNYWPMPRTDIEFINIGLGAKIFVGGEPLQ